jgi:hypothetical protein
MLWSWHGRMFHTGKSNCGGAPYVHDWSAQDSGADVLITSLVHGNEYTGAIVLSDLLAGEQHNSELARAREIRPYIERATHLLDLHSMHETCMPFLMTGLLPRNVAFAQSMGGVGQIVMDAGHKDGVRMRDFSGFGSESGSKIALLLEAGQHWQHWQQASVAAARNVVMRFLLRTEVLSMQDVITAGLQSWLARDRPSPAPVRVTHAVVAQSIQFEFTQAYTSNEVVQNAGTVIAHDQDQTITTPYDDCVLVMPSIRQLSPGVTTVRLGQHVSR